MVKNYLVCAVRPISDGWHIERNQDLYRFYQEMYQLRLASFRKFVHEPFEAVLWTDEVRNNDEYTVANWEEIKRLWHSEPCNIFWAGADTMMLKPTKLFGDAFTEYRLFNYTDPKQHREFAHHFNDDIQYFPHTMKEETWQLGDQYWQQREGHPDRYWGFDQLRHNAMFWSQDIPSSDRLHPEMAWQAQNLRSNGEELIGRTHGKSDAVVGHEKWNQLPFDQAHIIHFHASRGSQAVIDIMKHLCKQLEIAV